MIPPYAAFGSAFGGFPVEPYREPGNPDQALIDDLDACDDLASLASRPVVHRIKVSLDRGASFTRLRSVFRDENSALAASLDHLATLRRHFPHVIVKCYRAHGSAKLATA